jgi:hypothetical protein
LHHIGLARAQAGQLLIGKHFVARGPQARHAAGDAAVTTHGGFDREACRVVQFAIGIRHQCLV